jgi:hypothetical protein
VRRRRGTWRGACTGGFRPESGARSRCRPHRCGPKTGTPGTATVTISGGPRSTISNPCGPTGQCPETIYETGTVSVMVDGETFTSDYGGPSNQASWLASDLANQMNYPLSPISATVSGSTITITSVVNGSLTDYPLATSGTFNNVCPLGTLKCFFIPAYSAFASGMTLTGGTD